MSFLARCPQCLFVSRQLGQRTPCLLHVSRADEGDSANLTSADAAPSINDYDEPYAFGQLHLTVDRPGPFSLREYVRLQLLRCRVHATLSTLDQPAPGAQVGTLSYR